MGALFLETGIQRPADRFYSAFQQIQNRLRGELQTQLTASSPTLTRSQFYLLRQLSRQGRMTISDLSAWMNVRQPTLTPMINRLEDSGLVIRLKDDKDRRMVRISLTEKGRQITESAEESWRELINRHLSELSAEDRGALIVLLERFAGLIG